MTVQHYAIMSPTLGLKQDIPTLLLQDAFVPDGQNTRMIDGEIQSDLLRGKLLTPVPDGNPVLKYFNLIKSDGTEKLFAFTTANIYKWDTGATVRAVAFTGSGTDDATSGGTYTGVFRDYYEVEIDAEGTPDTFKWSKNGVEQATGVAITGAAQTLDDGVTITFTGTDVHTLGDKWGIWACADGDWTSHCTPTLAGTATRWSVATINDVVIATNGVDKVLFGDDSTAFKIDWGSSDDIDGTEGIQYSSDPYYVTAAEWVTVFENYVILGNTVENSNNQPQRIRYSAVGDHTDWQNGGFIDIAGNDHLVEAGHHQDYLILFKTDSIHRMWLTTDSFVFAISTISKEVGCNAPDSIVNSKAGELFYFASDFTFREIQRGEASYPIRKTLRNIQAALVPGIKAALIPEYSEIWLSIPDGPAATANDTTHVYHPESQRWYPPRSHGIGAFGKYKQQDTYTWDTLPYPSWDEWGWDKWDSVENNADFAIDIIADASGYSFAAHQSSLDNGSSYTRTFVLASDLTQKQAIAFKKRLHRIKFYWRPSVDTDVTVYIRLDHENQWREVDTLSLSGADEIIINDVPVDYLARHFEIKCEATDPFQFVGALFEYTSMGTR